MVPVLWKSNGKDKEFEHNFLKFCRYLISEDNFIAFKIYQVVTTFNFNTEYEINTCYFGWTLNEMDMFACIKGK